MFSVRIEIPGDPKGMGRAKSRRIKLKDGREFTSHYTPESSRITADVIRTYAERAMTGGIPIDKAVVLSLCAYMPIPKSMTKRDRAGAMAMPPTVWPTGKPDFDNVTRFIDQLKGVVWRDDSLVVDAHLFKRYSDRPRLVVSIKEKTV